MGEDTVSWGLSLKDQHIFKEMGYVFGKQIGSGSYAKVLLTEQKFGNKSKQYACKIINTKEAPKEFIRKFLPRELDILSKVKHPNIVYIQGIFHRSGRILIFMQYAQEGDLLEYILRDNDVTEIKAKTWTYQILTALQYLHTLRIAHRDIKCENVLITKNLSAKLADFGFAKVVPFQNQKLVQSKTFCGSIAYVAPEVLKGKPYAPMISDIWSMGVLLYVVLNKSLPFPLDKMPPKAVYKMQKLKRWKFRSRAQEKLSPEAKQIVTSMLEPEVVKRPTAATLIGSDWFVIVDENGGEKKMVLNEYEKQAYHQAENAQRPTAEDPILDTNKFDLLPNKTEPYPSVTQLIKSVSAVQERINEPTDGDLEIVSTLERVSETLDLKGSDRQFEEVIHDADNSTLS